MWSIPGSCPRVGDMGATGMFRRGRHRRVASACQIRAVLLFVPRCQAPIFYRTKERSNKRETQIGDPAFVRSCEMAALNIGIRQSGAADHAARRNGPHRPHAGEACEEKACNPKSRTQQTRPPRRVARDQDKENERNVGDPDHSAVDPKPRRSLRQFSAIASTIAVIANAAR